MKNKPAIKFAEGTVLRTRDGRWTGNGIVIGSKLDPLMGTVSYKVQLENGRRARFTGAAIADLFDVSPVSVPVRTWLTARQRGMCRLGCYAATVVCVPLGLRAKVLVTARTRRSVVATLKASKTYTDWNVALPSIRKLGRVAGIGSEGTVIALW